MLVHVDASIMLVAQPNCTWIGAVLGLFIVHICCGAWLTISCCNSLVTSCVIPVLHLLTFTCTLCSALCFPLKRSMLSSDGDAGAVASSSADHLRDVHAGSPFPLSDFIFRYCTDLDSRWFAEMQVDGNIASVWDVRF